MTRRKVEDLRLPEPARSLLGRTRAILDEYVTPLTPDRSGWQIGGGTILAARWRHRESHDIDLLVSPRTETRFLQPEAAPELHRRLEAAGARRITFGRFSQILFEKSRIEMLAADPQPRVGQRRAIVDGIEVTALASRQILTGKFSNRSLNPPVRDLYDLAVAGTVAPRALGIAVNALAGDDIRWRLVSWEMEREKFAEEGAVELHGVPLRYEAIQADPTDHARRAVTDAVYRYVRLLAHDGVAVVETENRFGRETRNYDSPDELAERFEEDGNNAVLAAAGTDPERIRRETAVAMRNGESATILELDQDRAAWGW
jgi:hypothetical protein